MPEHAVQVPSYPMLAVTNRGRVFNLMNLRELSQWENPNRDGKLSYKRISILLDGRDKKLLVHRLVCEAFHGPPPSPEHEVAHGDNNPHNNEPSNLRWDTKIGNAADKTAAGRQSSKLTAEQAREIKHRLSQGERGKDLAAEYGISTPTVSEIRHGKYWKHV